jgi:uncharacterized protein YegP (UPF0339 family)
MSFGSGGNKMGKIEIYKDKKKEWRFRFKATNNRILCNSEGYKNKRDCIKAIKSTVNICLQDLEQDDIITIYETETKTWTIIGI